MTVIERNSVSLLSHIIYLIYNIQDLDKMRQEVLEMLKYTIPFDTANFFLIESDCNHKDVLTSPININTLNNTDLKNVIKNYMAQCSEIDSTHWLCNTKKAMAYRTTDFLSEPAFKNSNYYKEMLLPFHVEYGAQLVLAHEGISVGLLTLFRIQGSPNFSDTEIFYLDSLKEHLSTRLYQSKLHQPAFHQDTSLYIDKYGLTAREYEILELLFQGLTNESIAERLFITENTLRRHLYNLFNKMNIKHRWELFFIE